MPGLIVTARQTYYPIELSNSELLSHFNMIQEYSDDITQDILTGLSKYNPDWKLIQQQPEMNPQSSRHVMVSFLFKLSIISKVTNGIFFTSVRLYDRYTSKRILLRDQAKLVAATCLWLAAKTYGGCNHIINNYVIPTGGRFYGPNQRARIPRLSELVHYCNSDEINITNMNNNNNNNLFDESMFLQMEMHILETLNWNVYEPSMNDLILNVDENCLIQYELYQNQLKASSLNYANAHTNNNNHNQLSVKNTVDNIDNDNNSNNNRNSQDSTDSEATVDDLHQLISEDKELMMKIQLINLKRFLIDLSCWSYELLKFNLIDLSQSIFKMINSFTEQDIIPFLTIPDDENNNNNNIQTILINSIINIPDCLLTIYKEESGIIPFIFKVKEYYTNLQMASVAADLSRRKSNNNNNNNNSIHHSQYFDSYSPSVMIPKADPSSSIESSPVLSVTTPSSMSQRPNQSDNSIFSIHHYPYSNGNSNGNINSIMNMHNNGSANDSINQITASSSPVTPDLFTFHIANNIMNTNGSNNTHITLNPHNNVLYNNSSHGSILSVNSLPSVTNMNTNNNSNNNNKENIGAFPIEKNKAQPQQRQYPLQSTVLQQHTASQQNITNNHTAF